MLAFDDRRHAGRLLGLRLRARALGPSPLLLGLARGGVVVAAEAAAALGAPFDALVVRKLGAPGNPELAVGAVAPAGVRVLNEGLAADLGLDEEALAGLERRARAELERRETALRGGRPPPDVAGRTVIVVDDGLATGASMKAALEALRRLGAGRLMAAAPVASASAAEELESMGIETSFLRVEKSFAAVGAYYADFEPAEDEAVRALLAR